MRAAIWRPAVACIAGIISVVWTGGCIYGRAITDPTTHGPGGGPGQPDPKITVITLAPASIKGVPGHTVQVTATPKDNAGHPVAADTLSWASSNTRVATVSATGKVTLLHRGKARITAVAGGVSASVQATVDLPPPAPAASVSVSPTSVRLRAGGRAALTATVRDPAGNELSGRTVRWSSSTRSATVSARGLVKAIAVGSALITASVGELHANARVTISAGPPPPVASVSVSPSSATLDIGRTHQFTGSARDADGGVVAGVPLAWTSSNSDVATVSNSGLATAVAIGAATITAAAQGKSGSASIVVTTSGGGGRHGGHGGHGGHGRGGGGDLSGCGEADLVSWDFHDGTWGPLDHTNFIGGGHIVSDATAPAGFSGQWDWTTNGGDEGGQVNASFPSRQAAYVRFAYKQSSNFPDNGIKKILRFRAGSYDQLLGTLDIDGDQFIWFYDGLDPQHVFRQSAGPRPSQIRGDWHWFEVYNNISESGNLKFTVWLDGQKIIDGTDNASNQGLSFDLASPGGTFNAPAGNGIDWITSVGVSSACIKAPW